MFFKDIPSAVYEFDTVCPICGKEIPVDLTVVMKVIGERVQVYHFECVEGGSYGDHKNHK